MASSSSFSISRISLSKVKIKLSTNFGLGHIQSIINVIHKRFYDGIISISKYMYTDSTGLKIFVVIRLVTLNIRVLLYFVFVIVPTLMDG